MSWVLFLKIHQKIYSKFHITNIIKMLNNNKFIILKHKLSIRFYKFLLFWFSILSEVMCLILIRNYIQNFNKYEFNHENYINNFFFKNYIQNY